MAYVRAKVDPKTNPTLRILPPKSAIHLKRKITEEVTSYWLPVLKLTSIPSRRPIDSLNHTGSNSHTGPKNHSDPRNHINNQKLSNQWITTSPILLPRTTTTLIHLAIPLCSTVQERAGLALLSRWKRSTTPSYTPPWMTPSQSFTNLLHTSWPSPKAACPMGPLLTSIVSRRPASKPLQCSSTSTRRWRAKSTISTTS